MKTILTILALLFANTALAAPSRPRPWTFAFRSGWNQACFEALSATISKQGYKVNQVAVRNLCDCSSDLIQQKYSQETVEGYGDVAPKEFIDYCQVTVNMCLEPSTPPI